METKKIYLWAFLIIIWVSYIAWEFQVEKWAKTVEGPLIRIDLVIIFPIIVLTTIFVVYKTLNKKQ